MARVVIGAIFAKEASYILQTRGLELVFPEKQRSSAVADFKSGNQVGIKSYATLSYLCGLGQVRASLCLHFLICKIEV